MTESQKKAIVLLKEIQEICNENNTPFYLFNDTALKGYRSNGFEDEKPEIFLTMLYKDMISLYRRLKEKNLPDREFESLYSNKMLPSNFFRYVASDSLYWPVKNPLKLEKFGIAVTIIPLFSKKLDSKRSLKKYLYLYWSQNLGTKWTTKANSFIAKAVRRISAAICKNAGDNTREILLDKLYEFEKPASFNDKLYLYTTNKRKKIEFKRDFFEEAICVNFENIECKIPKDVDTYFRKIIGKKWPEKTYKGKAVQKFLLIDNMLPYKEYFEYLEENNVYIDIERELKEEADASREYKKYNKITTDAWSVVQRTDARIKLWQQYSSEKEYILHLYDSEMWDDLSVALEAFDSENRNWAKKKTAVSFDNEIWEIYLQWLRHNGEEKFADKIDKLLPEEYRENFEILL